MHDDLFMKGVITQVKCIKHSLRYNALEILTRRACINYIIVPINVSFYILCISIFRVLTKPLIAIFLHQQMAHSFKGCLHTSVFEAKKMALTNLTKTLKAHENLCIPKR